MSIFHNHRWEPILDDAVAIYDGKRNRDALVFRGTFEVCRCGGRRIIVPGCPVPGEVEEII